MTNMVLKLGIYGILTFTLVNMIFKGLNLVYMEWDLPKRKGNEYFEYSFLN